MRKNILTLGLVATAFIASQSAYASRARNTVMGTADRFGAFSGASHGSLYVDDAYNMFYSPAQINNFKNFVTIEKSNGNNDGTTNSEGGFVSSFGDMNYGVFLNRTSGIRGEYGDAAQATPFTSTSFQPKMRTVDLMVGGDVGVKYGLGLQYAAFNNHNAATKVNATAKNLNLRAGIEMNSLEVFGDINVIGKNKLNEVGVSSDNNMTEVKNKTYGIGTRYKYGEWQAFAGYRNSKVDASGNLIVAATQNQSTDKVMYVGAGRNAKLSDSTTLNYAVSYQRSKTTTKNKGQAVEPFTKQVVLPADISLESELASWFIARAGMSFDLMNRGGGSLSGSQTAPNDARLGGTFRFGKVDVDFAMSTDATDVNAAADPTLTGSSFGFSKNLVSYASMTYHW